MKDLSLNIAAPKSMTVPQGIRNVTEPLLSVPRDLAWHWGPIYKNNHYGEWHYFSLSGKTEEGHDCSIFLANLVRGWDVEQNRPGVYSLISYTNQTTKEFYYNQPVYIGDFESSGNIDDPDNYSFSYKIADESMDPSWFREAYDHNSQTWKIKVGSKLENPNPISLEATAKVLAPGYVPPSYGGFELAGFDPNACYNPATLYGISYYIIAPRLDFKGDIVVNSQKHTVTGLAWYEQQYGNVFTPDALFATYFYCYCRLNNGDMFTCRQNYATPDFSTPERDQNHWLYMRKSGGMDIKLGPAFTFEVNESWKSPKSGMSFPIYSILNTPVGKFWINPKGFPDQEITNPLGNTYEVLFEFHEGGPTGPIVGEGYVELMNVASYIPGTPFTSLKDQPDLAYRQPGW